MLYRLDDEGRLKIAIGDVRNQTPAKLETCFVYNLNLELIIEPDSESSPEESHD
jgi:hypothetical protein